METKQVYIDEYLQFHSIKTTGNFVGNLGKDSLSHSLKGNTTLTELNLNGKHKKDNHT